MIIGTIEVTLLSKAGGLLTKRLHLTPSGALANDSSQCRMSRGRVERVRLADWREFARMIEATKPHVAYALGRMVAGLPDTAQLVLKSDPQAGQPGFVSRTQSNFIYEPGKPAFVLVVQRREGGRARRGGNAEGARDCDRGGVGQWGIEAGRRARIR